MRELIQTESKLLSWQEVARRVRQPGDKLPPGMTEEQHLLNIYMTLMDWWATHYWRWYLPINDQDSLKPEQREIGKLVWAFKRPIPHLVWSAYASKPEPAKLCESAIFKDGFYRAAA